MKTSCWFNRNSGNRSPSLWCFVFPLLLACFALASAATITVTNNNDNGAGSLRQAISDSSPGDTIDFDSSLTGQTITLTTGELVIDKNLTITGPGANLLAVDGNHASRVCNIGPGFEVTIFGLTVSNGFSPDLGGGILNSGSLMIASTTLSGNGAYDGGGGIYNDGGSVRAMSSTLAGNLATNGGGIYNAAGSLTIANSTLSGNSCINAGGGIVNDSGAVTIANSTFSGNSANFGGGILNSDALTMNLGNTILNAGTQGANIVNVGTGIVTSFGYNMSSDPGGGFLYAAGDRINTNPQLNFLADNGGPTFTHALLPGSPAINAGDPNFDPNSFTPPLLYDQRGPGFSRVAGNRIDIGAFEVQEAATPTPTPTPTATPTSTGTATPTPTPGTSNINVSPLNLSFGNQPVGTTGSQMTTTISNTGTSDLHISPSIGGTNPTDFVIVYSSSTTITPGDSAYVLVTFTPPAIGNRSATLSISSDDPDQPTTDVSLSGIGTEPTATPTPSPTPTPTATPTATPGPTEADLLIGIGVDRTTVRQGDLLTYTITVRNFGPSTAVNAVVNDLLSSGSTFVSASANRGVFTAPPIGQAGTVTWYLGDLLNNGQESAQISVTVIVRGRTTITNTASVTSNTADPNTANNTTSITTTVAQGGRGNGHGH